MNQYLKSHNIHITRHLQYFRTQETMLLDYLQYLEILFLQTITGLTALFDVKL